MKAKRKRPEVVADTSEEEDIGLVEVPSDDSSDDFLEATEEE